MASAQSEGQGQGQATITILPKNSKQATADVPQEKIRAEVDGRKVNISQWRAWRGQQDGVELVILIDGGAVASLGREMGDIRNFVNGLPPNVKSTIGYMENGRSILTGPLTTDHAKILQGLHLPMGVPGENASPYFCLSDLAKHWPSQDRNVRREVVMVTDGVDYYELRYDPEDPYVQAAIHDSVQARLVVYSIYWRNRGFVDRTGYENDAGQNLLLQVTQSTGGNSYWIGFGNPVSFAPYFDDLNRRLKNQYELSFTVPLKGRAQVENLKVQTSAPGVKVTAPQKVYVSAGAGGQQ